MVFIVFAQIYIAPFFSSFFFLAQYVVNQLLNVPNNDGRNQQEVGTFGHSCIQNHVEFHTVSL